MSETITVKGKVYEIGKVYGFEFKRSNARYYGELIDFDGEGFIIRDPRELRVPYVVDRIFEIGESAGTIKDAPIELIDGEWYKFEVERVTVESVTIETVGRWCDKKGGFVINFMSNTVYDQDDIIISHHKAFDIRRMIEK